MTQATCHMTQVPEKVLWCLRRFSSAPSGALVCYRGARVHTPICTRSRAHLRAAGAGPWGRARMRAHARASDARPCAHSLAPPPRVRAFCRAFWASARTAYGRARVLARAPVGRARGSRGKPVYHRYDARPVTPQTDFAAPATDLLLCARHGPRCTWLTLPLRLLCATVSTCRLRPNQA